MMKDCDGREPVLSEVLFYTKALGSMAADMPAGFNADALVASALVVGAYCKPNLSSNPSAEAAFAKLRAAYATGTKIKVRVP